LGFPTTYDDVVNEKDPIEKPLAFNLEEEYEEDRFSLMFGGLYPQEDDQLEEEVPIDDIANYEEVNKDLSSEVPNFNDEEFDYDDFLGVEDILNFPNNDFGELYADEKNYMFIRETMADPFLSIFKAHGREKEREKNDKSEVLPSGV
jgi:hypothetical protein